MLRFRPRLSSGCLAALFLILSSVLSAQIPAQGGLGKRLRLDSPGRGFIQAKGRDLVEGQGGTPLRLRGINNGSAMWVVINGNNWVLDDPFDQGVPEYQRLWEGMFRDTASLGMNVVRLNLNYRYFETNANPGVYQQEAWDLLDRAVSWAKANNLYLTLAMVVPPGGYQPSGGGGAALWDDPAMQNRLLDLWSAIADRYSEEPVISGYDLLNEPNPTQSAAQWRVLAQKLADRIRLVDANHLLIVEEVNWIVDANGVTPHDDGEPWIFLINDDNVMVDVHFYDVLAYTQQLVGEYPEFGPYPDPSKSFDFPPGSVWDREFLTFTLAERLRFGIDQQVPMNVGEWGAGVPSFLGDFGALLYTQDLAELLDENQANYTYFTYDRIFFQPWEIEQNPVLGQVQDDLINLFQAVLGAPPANSLVGTPAHISLSSGGIQNLTFQAGPALAGGTYRVLGSASGTQPGIPLAHGILPLNFDAYFRLTLHAGDSKILRGASGILDDAGAAEARIVLPSRLIPQLEGRTLNHSFLVFDRETGAVVLVSNPVPLELTP